MNDRRELIFGFLSALLSIFIVGGSFAISYAEVKPKLGQIRADTPGLTRTQTPTKIIFTPRPGEATLTPSPTLPDATPTVASPTPACQFPADWIAISINPGDTLESLAKTYQTTSDALIEGNCLFITTLSAGSQLYVPQPHASLTPTRTRTPRPIATYCAGPPSGWVIYIIQSGDTLYSLSQIYDLSVAELKVANCLSSDLIKTGTNLWVPFIPTKTPLPSPSYITVIKKVINDNGGSAAPDDFLLTLNGGSVTSGVQVPVNPGTYTAAETQLSGYTFEGFSGDCDSNGTVTVALGESKTCTLTNNDDAPSLTLVKQVITDNGGTAVAGNWTLTAAGYNPANPQTGTYALSESGPANYTQTSLTCDNSTGQVTSVTLGLGEDVTCTFVNDDDAPSLTLVKEVITDNGGTAVAGDWTLTAAGYDPANPQIGTYTLSESGPTNYTQTSLTCDNSTGQVTSVTLGLGEDVTCTFVNDDNAPSLTLIKEVINDNVGTAVAGNWTLTAAGYNAALPQIGTYDLSESGPEGYTLTSLTCSNANGQVASVTLGLGEDVTCTFVNDDDAPSLTLIKEVINDNGGNALPDAFLWTFDGGSVTSGVQVPVDLGPYTNWPSDPYAIEHTNWHRYCNFLTNGHPYTLT